LDKRLLSNNLTEKVSIHNKEFVLLIDEQTILDRVKTLAEHISQNYAEKSITIIAILNGSFIFSADLIRQISVPVEIEFIKISSYSGTSSLGEIKQTIGLNNSLEGKNILVVEDIIDSGLTLSYIIDELKQTKINSISVASLLVKPNSLKHPITIDYTGFEIADEFVVGYGLDYDGLGRNLRGIYQAI
jgi:hypoxanthine phosphoribosyltransferase